MALAQQTLQYVLDGRKQRRAVLDEASVYVRACLGWWATSSEADQLTKAEAKLCGWAERLGSDTDSHETYSRGDAHAYLSEATAEVGNTLAYVALVMQRAIQNTEDIRAHALAIDHTRTLESQLSESRRLL